MCFHAYHIPGQGRRRVVGPRRTVDERRLRDDPGERGVSHGFGRAANSMGVHSGSPGERFRCD